MEKKARELLIGIADLHGAALQPGANGIHEVLPDGLLDDDDGGAEPRLIGIVQRIVQDCFPLTSHGIDLLQAAVPAAHSCRHYNKDRFASQGQRIFCIVNDQYSLQIST